MTIKFYGSRPFPPQQIPPALPEPDGEIGWFLSGYPVFFGIDPAKPGSDQTVVSANDPYAAIAEQIFADAEKQRNEHIWGMIVLAAKSSRYEP